MVHVAYKYSHTAEETFSTSEFSLSLSPLPFSISPHMYTYRLQKALREFNKQVDSSSHLGGAWDSTQLNQIDRSLGLMRRTLSGSDTNASDQLCFCQLGGLASVLKMLLLCSEPDPNCGSGQHARARPLLPEK